MMFVTIVLSILSLYNNYTKPTLQLWLHIIFLYSKFYKIFYRCCHLNLFICHSTQAVLPNKNAHT